MFLEWENNSGKLQIISLKFRNSGKFQNKAINDVKQISLSHLIKRKKIRVEILNDSILNDNQEKGVNESADMNIKTWKHPGTSSTDKLNHIKSSLRKEPDQTLIHAGTNGPTKDHNHLNNMKKIVKMIIQICKDTKLGFSLLIR